MASTQFGVNHPLARKAWANRLMTETIKETYVGRFIGKSDSSLIQRKDELSKDAGDKITFGLRVQMSGNGVSGDSTLEGNEEALTFYDDSVVVDQLRHATRSSGKMSEQRVPYDMREQGMSALRDWWANRLDTSFANQITGYTPQSDLKFTGMNAVVGATNIIRAGSGVTDDASLGSGDKFNLNLIDACIEKAKTISPLMNPIRVNGEEKYVMFLHPFQVYDMRTSTSAGQWLDIQKAATQGGQQSNNAIFTGALGEYNNVVLHQWTRLPQGVANAGTVVTTVRRAAFCGAQAAAIAFANAGSDTKFDWKEELFDYENQLGIGAGLIFGMKKTVFNSNDFGAIVVPTYAVAHA